MSPCHDFDMDEKPEQVHRSFQEAFNRHDLEALCALYEPEAVLVTSGGPARGLAAIREVYLGFLTMRPTIELQTVGAYQAGELALLQGKWVLRGTGPDGAEMHSEGRNNETVRRQADGRWLFVIDNPGVAE